MLIWEQTLESYYFHFWNALNASSVGVRGSSYRSAFAFADPARMRLEGLAGLKGRQGSRNICRLGTFGQESAGTKYINTNSAMKKCPSRIRSSCKLEKRS